MEAIDHATKGEMLFLASLIMGTTIPKGHDAILAAWDQRYAKFFGTKTATDFHFNDGGVRSHILAQKQEAEEEVRKGKADAEFLEAMETP